MKFFLFILIIFVTALDVQAQFARTDRMMIRRMLVLRKAVEPLYRKPSAKELKAIAPSAELRNKYAEFLRQPNTGLTKLINDRGCSENTKVVVVSDECLQYTMPGSGSSFSFRTQNYRIPRLADITFTNNSFQATGAILHGIFVKLGDVPLESVTLETESMKYLVDFQPETDYEKARQIDLELSEGVEQNGFLYRRGFYAVENTTYALRSIAYGGKFYRAVQGVTYNEFDFDRRKDVIVIFPSSKKIRRATSRFFGNCSGKKIRRM
jgi:hypothetical protein